jgi:hypothetical protein
MQRIILVVLLTIVTGCSWASQMSYKGRAYLGLTEENLVLNDVSSLKDAGIVIGRVIRENVTGGFADYIDRLVIFKNLNTGQEFNYYDGDYFFMKLAEGQYEIIGFETKMGIPLRSVNGGFKFKVRNGEITYIGNIEGEKIFKRFDKILSRGISSRVFVSGYYNGGASLFIPRANDNYTFYVIDDKQKLLKQFNSLFPNLSGIEVKTDLMN